MADYTLATGGTLDLSTEANTDGNSNQTNDTIVGSSGDDKIIAGASTPQPYIVNPSAPVDHQVVGTVQDNDTIVEASGNNTLTGGYGNDKFVFNIGFGVEQQTLHYDDIHQTPTQVSGANTNGVWNSYLSNLNEWRAEMTALYGQDQNTSDVQTQNYTYGAKNQQSGSATYDDNFTYSAVHTNTSTTRSTTTATATIRLSLLASRRSSSMRMVVASRTMTTAAAPFTSGRSRSRCSAPL